MIHELNVVGSWHDYITFAKHVLYTDYVVHVLCVRKAEANLML